MKEREGKRNRQADGQGLGTTVLTSRGDDRRAEVRSLSEEVTSE